MTRALVALVLALTAAGADCGGPAADPSVCCTCLYDEFPSVGEPCIYESAQRCKEHLVDGDGPDTWAVCVDFLCHDECAGFAVDVIGDAP